MYDVPERNLITSCQVTKDTQYKVLAS